MGRDLAFHNTDCESLCLAGAWERIVEFLSCGALVLKLQWGSSEIPMLAAVGSPSASSPDALRGYLEKRLDNAKGIK